LAAAIPEGQPHRNDYIMNQVEEAFKSKTHDAQAYVQQKLLFIPEIQALWREGFELHVRNRRTEENGKETVQDDVVRHMPWSKNFPASYEEAYGDVKNNLFVRKERNDTFNALARELSAR